MLPFECVVPGTPVSLQTRNRSSLRQWKTKVATHAALAWPQGVDPLVCGVMVTIVFYFEGTPLDVDNMIKPIQDALVGIVYDDDKQVNDVRGSVRDLDGSFRVKGLSPELAKGFGFSGPFVHIKVTEPPDPEVLV
jgi:crossover junction endodeoxyribonuclease RusA